MGRAETGARRGFTLVETALVIVLVGLLLALALPRLAEGRRSLQLDSAAYQLAGDLRRAQVEAIKRNLSVKLSKTGASTYNIQFIGDRTFEDGVTFGAGTADSVRMASFGPPVTGVAAFTVARSGMEKTVRVSAAGLVSVQ